LNNRLPFSNKVARTTGAWSGMGEATAEAIAAVVLAEVRKDAMKAAATEKLAAAGHKAFAVRCDVSDDADVAAMSRAVEDRPVKGNGGLKQTERER
jgi:NAD(P)-dependent dehydrogenase (short-subunit alcohol dehydrogenase family)